MGLLKRDCTINPIIAPQIVPIDTVTGFNSVLNYGSDKLRFTGPVPVGSSVHSRNRVREVSASPKGTKMVLEQPEPFRGEVNGFSLQRSTKAATGRCQLAPFRHKVRRKLRSCLCSENWGFPRPRSQNPPTMKQLRQTRPLMLKGNRR